MGVEEQDEPQLPEELEDEEESPFLRRQKALSVRRGRLSRRLRWVLFGLFVALPVGCVGYFAASFALTSPRFRLGAGDEVVVSGNRFVSREEVLNALNLPLNTSLLPGINVFRISLEDKRRAVETIPWVQSATVTRVLPNRMTVQVVERTPVAFVNLGGRVSLVDAEGTILEKPDKATFDFPVLAGLEAARTLDERRARLALYQDFMRQVAEEMPRAGWAVSEVDLAEGDDLRALLVQGTETVQVHFGHQDFLERFRNFLVLLPELRRSNLKLDSVDLRYRNQIVVNPQPVAPPPAAGGASAPPDSLKE